MSRVVIFLFLAAVAAAVRQPLVMTRLCESITDCEACLLLPSCYATHRPIFRCLQYPLTDTYNNNTIIIEKAACCPTSVHFEPGECGFGSKPIDSEDDVIIPWPYIAGGTTAVVVILLAGGAFVVYKMRQRRGQMTVSSPCDEHPVRAPPSVPTTSGSRSQKRPQQENMAELLQREINSKVEAEWINRRHALLGHPMDQTTV